MDKNSYDNNNNYYSRGYGNGYDQGQDQPYAMQNMTQHSYQRDTYGLPYSNSNENYYNNDQYPPNYNGGATDNQYIDHQNAYAAPAAAQPKYYNGFEDDGTQPIQGENRYDGTSIRSNSGVTPIKPVKERSRCLPCFPCIRSTCGRITACLCILLLLVIIVIVILVFAVFKMPTVDYLGMAGDPTFKFNDGNTTLGVNFLANIQVKNPNPIGFNFEKIVATAYYPGYQPPIGGGNMTHVDFPSKSTKVIQFPITASYDQRQDPGFTVIQSILTKCGLTGGNDGEITINYDIKATLKIIGIPISPSIKNQATNIACPTDISQITGGIPGAIVSGIGSLISGKRR